MCRARWYHGQKQGETALKHERERDGRQAAEDAKLEAFSYPAQFERGMAARIYIKRQINILLYYTLYIIFNTLLTAFICK